MANRSAAVGQDSSGRSGAGRPSAPPAPGLGLRPRTLPASRATASRPHHSSCASRSWLSRRVVVAAEALTMDALPAPYLVWSATSMLSRSRAVPFADVLDADVSLQPRDPHAGSARARCVTEPSGVSSVPGPHVHLVIGADNPDRCPATQGAVGTLDRDVQFAGCTDALQLVRGPGGGRLVRDGHQGTAPSASNCWPVGPSSGRVASRIATAAPCSGVLVPEKLLRSLAT